MNLDEALVKLIEGIIFHENEKKEVFGFKNIARSINHMSNGKLCHENQFLLR